MFIRVDRLSFDTDGLTILPTFSYSPFVRIFLINYIFLAQGLQQTYANCGEEYTGGRT